MLTLVVESERLRKSWRCNLALDKGVEENYRKSV